MEKGIVTAADPQVYCLLNFLCLLAVLIFLKSVCRGSIGDTCLSVHPTHEKQVKLRYIICPPEAQPQTNNTFTPPTVSSSYFIDLAIIPAEDKRFEAEVL